MSDFFEEMWALEQQKFAEVKKFQAMPEQQKVDYLNQKLDWEHYEKIKYEFFLEIFERYYFDDEVMSQVWKNWLKITLYAEFLVKNGIVAFFHRNPHLKNEMIAELNHIIATNPIKVTSSQGWITDDKPIYFAALVLWDLGYKNALQDFIKKYRKECDLYFDEDDYRKISLLDED